MTFKYKFSIMTSVSISAEVSPNGRAAAWKAVGVKRLVGSSPLLPPFLKIKYII